MSESFLLVIASMFIALLLVGLFLKAFNNVSGKSFTLSDLLQIKFILSFIIAGLFAGFISGIYPALYLSSVKPVAVLKGEQFREKATGG